MALLPLQVICPHRLYNLIPSNRSPGTFSRSDVPLQTPIPKHLRLILIIIIIVATDQVIRVVNMNEIVDN
jgi:hypothetical protein